MSELSLTFAVLIALTLLPGCATTSDTGGDTGQNVPHDVMHGGVGHASGAGDPETNCVECHGADLRGGDNAEPSCFSCHGQVW